MRKNLKIFLKSSKMRYLKLFKKYLSLFSNPLHPKSLIYSRREAAFNLPISMKSYSLKDKKFWEYLSFFSNIFDSNSQERIYFISLIYLRVNLAWMIFVLFYFFFKYAGDFGSYFSLSNLVASIFRNLSICFVSIFRRKVRSCGLDFSILVSSTWIY